MNPHFRKKLIIVSAAFVVAIGVVIILLIRLPNYIIKQQLERAMGDNFRVERISLSWGSVEVFEPKFLKDGQTAAYAKRIILKTHLLALLRPGFSISSVFLEEPFLNLEISPSGKWVGPIVIEKKQETSSTSKPGPLDIRHIVVKDGTLFFQDHRLQDPNSIEVQKLNLSLDDFSIPFQNVPSKFALQFRLAGKLFSGFVTSSGTFNFGTLGTNVRFEGQNLALLDTSAAGPAFRVETISFTATSEGIPANPLVLSDVVSTKPYVRLERDRKGTITSPLMGVIPRQTGSEKQRGIMGQVEVKNLKTASGELLFLDGEIGKRPFPIRLTDISLNADSLSFPPEGRYTTYELSGHIPGNESTGVLISSGRTNLKTLDTNGKVSLSDLDLTALKPYIVKQGDVDVSRGFLDLSMDLGIKEKAIYAPAHVVIKDLVFVTGRGVKDEFLGIPRSQIVKALETSNHRIGFDFTLEGSLENPQFNFRGSLVKRFTIGLAKSLGLSVIESGESVIILGGQAIWDVGKEVQKLFK